MQVMAMVQWKHADKANTVKVQDTSTLEMVMVLCLATCMVLKNSDDIVEWQGFPEQTNVMVTIEQHFQFSRFLC